MQGTNKRQRNPELPRLCQLLPALYQRLQQNHDTPIQPHKEGKGWEWSHKQQEAFETLKKAMIMEPILQHFDPKRPVTIETDATDYSIGAICSQPDEKGILHPVAYYTRKLKDPERNYDIHDKELLAIVDALQK